MGKIMPYLKAGALVGEIIVCCLVAVDCVKRFLVERKSNQTPKECQSLKTAATPTT